MKSARVRLSIVVAAACSVWSGTVRCDSAESRFFDELAAKLASHEKQPLVSLPRLEFGLLIHAEKPEQARRFCRERLARKAVDLPLQFAYAMSYERLYSGSRCFRELEKLRPGHPKNPRIYCELAGRSLRWGDPRTTRAFLMAALEIDPLCSFAHYGLALWATPSVIRQISVTYGTRALLVEEPGSALSIKAAGVIDNVLSNPNRPIVPWDAEIRIAGSKLAARVASHEKRDEVPFRQLSYALLMHSGKYEQAEAFYRQRLASVEQEPALQLSHARLLALRGNFSGSMTLLEKLDKQLPRNPRILYEMAVTQLEQDRKPAAGRYLAQATKINALFAPAHYRLALLAAENGNRDECVQHSIDVLLIERPGSPLAEDAARLIDKHVIPVQQD